MERVAKKVICKALNAFLGWLIEDLDEDNIAKAFQNGKLNLENVYIKKDALVSTLAWKQMV